MCVTPGSYGASAENFNIILWADHRAHEEASTINGTGSMVLKYVGETVRIVALNSWTQRREDVTRDGDAQSRSYRTVHGSF